MNPEDIAHLRKLLTIHMNTALEGGQQFDEEGKIALASKYGGRAGGLQLAIDLLEMVAATPVKPPLSRASDPSKSPATTCAESQIRTRTDQPESSAISLPEAGLVEAASMMWGVLMQMPLNYGIGPAPIRGAHGSKIRPAWSDSVAADDVLPHLQGLCARIVRFLAPVPAFQPAPCTPQADRPSTASAAQVPVVATQAYTRNSPPDAPIPAFYPFPSAD